MNRISLITACLLILTGCNFPDFGNEKQINAMMKDVAEMKQMLADIEKKQSVKPVNAPKKKKSVRKTGTCNLTPERKYADERF